MYLDSWSSEPEKLPVSSGFVRGFSEASVVVSGLTLFTPSLPEWLPLPSDWLLSSSVVGEGSAEVFTCCLLYLMSTLVV